MQTKLTKITSLVLCFVLSFSVFAYATDESVSITTYSNGAESDKYFNNGIFTAQTSGTGSFVIARYLDEELKGITLATSDEALTKLNVVLSDVDSREAIKVFRIDENGNPLCVNSELTPKLSDHRIYVNKTFDEENHDIYYSEPSVSRYIEDGRMCLAPHYDETEVDENGNPIQHSAGFTTYVRNHGKKIIYEMDVEVVDPINYRLISTSYGESSVFSFVRMYPDGRYTPNFHFKIAGSDTKYFTKGNKFHLAIKIDFEKMLYGIYIDRELLVGDIPVGITEDTHYNRNRAFQTRHASNFDDGKIYIDNVRCYEGEDFLFDLTNEKNNVSHTDHSPNTDTSSCLVNHISSEEIAAKTLAADHPRLLGNMDKIDEIAESDDPTVVAMREAVMAKADGYIADNYLYGNLKDKNGNPWNRWLSVSSSGSMYDIGETIEMMMNLGYAYLSTGNTKYSNHAWKQLELIFERPDWNSASYLDVGEVSFILALAYDWMYDAWTHEQKEILSADALSKGIDLSYRVYYGENTNLIRSDGKLYESQTGWWDNKNNWNAICNGGAILASIAFMEYDAYRCSKLAEAAIGGIEYLLPGFAPAGAWEEGPTYWQYTLRYLTAVDATLTNVLGHDCGIKDAPGMENTHLYALSLEGKTGVVQLADVNGTRVHSPQLYYWAKVYDRPEYGGAADYITEKFGQTRNVFDMIYYDADYVADSYVPPLTFYTEGTETVSFMSGYDDDDTFVNINGGSASTNHSHMDSGSVVIDMKGESFVRDIGAGDYRWTGYFSSNLADNGYRFLYYRTRPEGHNTFVINPMDSFDTDDTTVYYGQYKDAYSKAVCDEKNQTATMNLSDAYARDASNATRHLSLDGDAVIINDSITLKEDKTNSEIHWYFHLSDGVTAVIDGNKAILTKNGKSITFTFELTSNSDAQSIFEVVDAKHNVADSRASDELNSETYGTRKKLRFKLTGASDTVNMKITVE